MKALIPTEQRCESLLDKAYMNSLELNLIAVSYYLLDKKGFTPQETKEAVDYIFEFCDSMRVNGIQISEIKAELEKDYGFAVRRKGHILSVGIKKKEEEEKMKWRPFEHKGIWLTGEITKHLYDEVFITFWNYNGRLDVTHCPVVDVPSGHKDIAALGERACVMEEVAWMPATLPKPFSNEDAPTEWVPIHQGLPKLGADVFVTVELPNKYLVVKHARLIPYAGDSCRFQFVSGWDCHDKIITAWTPAKIPKPYKINNSVSMKLY